MRALRIGASLVLLSLCGCNATGRPDYIASAVVAPEDAAAPSPHQALDQRISQYAKTYKIPESLVHAVVQRESKYNPGLKHGPFWGLMQIRHETAKSMGYSGPARGLLNPETNLTYATAYLANAYRVAEGDERRAIRLYAGGYYYEAKRRGLLRELHSANDFTETAAATSDAAPRAASRQAETPDQAPMAFSSQARMSGDAENAIDQASASPVLISSKQAQ
jgi:hypothetical protein